MLVFLTIINYTYYIQDMHNFCKTTYITVNVRLRCYGEWYQFAGRKEIEPGARLAVRQAKEGGPRPRAAGRLRPFRTEGGREQKNQSMNRIKCQKAALSMRSAVKFELTLSRQICPSAILKMAYLWDLSFWMLWYVFWHSSVNFTPDIAMVAAVGWVGRWHWFRGRWGGRGGSGGRGGGRWRGAGSPRVGTRETEQRSLKTTKRTSSRDPTSN